MKYAGTVTMTAQEFAEIVLRMHELEEEASSKETFKAAWEAVRGKAERLESELAEYKRRYGDGVDGE